MKLRDYQIKLQDDILGLWSSGIRNVMGVSPTGSGKTKTGTNLILRTGWNTCFIAHRQELVIQISEALAEQGVFHNLIAATAQIGFCVERHIKLFGRSFYNPSAKVAVAGVKTLTNRRDKLQTFLHNTQLWVIDEAHHVLPENQWGKAVTLFPNARGLGLTATPMRCDRKPLDGIFEGMAVGPSMRTLINQGHLTDYRIFCPKVSLDLKRVRISDGTGEFRHDDLVEETARSQIVGDVVSNYLKFAPGKRGLTFVVDMVSGERIAQTYEANGVPAALVNAQTPDRIRINLLERLARGDIKQLVNVDLFGEGMDCPALDVVSMARPTQSYGLYVQQFGRMMRPSPGKDRGILIDHVGNVLRHGLPDAPREWSLTVPDGRKSKAKNPDDIPLTTCEECFQPYESFHTECPFCGAVKTPASRATPQEVDGDLEELDPATLARMRGEISRIDGTPQIPYGATQIMEMAIKRDWLSRQAAQVALRDTIATWAGIRKHGHGETDREIQKRFYFGFGIDIASAMVLNENDATALQAQIDEVCNGLR